MLRTTISSTLQGWIQRLDLASILFVFALSADFWSRLVDADLDIGLNLTLQVRIRQLLRRLRSELDRRDGRLREGKFFEH